MRLRHKMKGRAVIVTVEVLKYVVIFADVASDPRTYIYERKEGPLELKFWNEKGFHFPGEAHHHANSIFMIWENESHFKYIKI